MSVEIVPKACILVARGQTWQNHASWLKKTQLVDSLEVPTSLHQCSGSAVVGRRVQSEMMKNVHLACSEAFDVQLKNSGSSELVGNVPEKDNFIQAYPRLEKDVC